jgi:hypothetical protein
MRSDMLSPDPTTTKGRVDSACFRWLVFGKRSTMAPGEEEANGQSRVYLQCWLGTLRIIDMILSTR